MPGGHLGKTRGNPRITLPKQLSALVVTLPPDSKVKAERPEQPEIINPDPVTGCTKSPDDPTSVDDSLGATVIAKYALGQGDAIATDGATFKGAAQAPTFRLVPIFYGTAWLTSQPTNAQVNAQVRQLLQSPYLGQLDQYGFDALELLQPMLVNVSAAATHTSSGKFTFTRMLL